MTDLKVLMFKEFASTRDEYVNLRQEIDVLRSLREKTKKRIELLDKLLALDDPARVVGQSQRPD
jgi:hypothetical protein